MTAAAPPRSLRKEAAGTLLMKTQHTGTLDQSRLISLTGPTISWAQLERGRLDVAYRVVQAAAMVVSSRTTSLAIQLEGALEPGKTAIATVGSLRPGSRWLGQEVDSETVAVSDDVLDLRTTSLSTSSAIVVDRHELQSQFSSSLDAADIVDALRHTGVSRRPLVAERLRKSIEAVCAAGGLPKRSIDGVLIPFLAAVLPKSDSYSVERSYVANRRYAAVRFCEQYMREHLDTRITMLDLSVACGMRSRTLSNAFEAITGFGPIEYLKRLRLSAVRRALQCSDGSQVKVTDVAMDWGFWHMGHFGRDYRMMFGESPSQTLRPS